jgi:hypothetical protein
VLFLAALCLAQLLFCKLLCGLLVAQYLKQQGGLLDAAQAAAAASAAVLEGLQGPASLVTGPHPSADDVRALLLADAAAAAAAAGGSGDHVRLGAADDVTPLVARSTSLASLIGSSGSSGSRAVAELEVLMGRAGWSGGAWCTTFRGLWVAASTSTGLLLLLLLQVGATWTSVIHYAGFKCF